ncbi:hypothetical protein CRG98_043073 [Punica granatum]|uniref:Uncharacterized protein n=1 Tax=Punica granatum TaxID=22663 RepID=A0A2I0HYB2_PUNGR|nr:hypothetical protein CRG98_043073 [Punica granatum]
MDCIPWFNIQAQGSVLYVSFGSMASMDEHDLLEMAQGLALSWQPFIWVVLQDQALNTRYACNVWRVGSELEKENVKGEKIAKANKANGGKKEREFGKEQRHSRSRIN